ncbi:MAG: DUF222 domain-containing protein [Kofleriaceae bacterium]
MSRATPTWLSERYCITHVMRIDTEVLGERIAEHVAHIEAAMHLLLTELREFDGAGGWARQGAQSCAHWLSWRVGWSLGTAREHVRVANRLGELPQINDALRRGEVSYSKVRAMSRVANEANETVLLEEARLTTGQQLETICRKYAMVQRHGSEAKLDDDRERRHVTRSDTSDGMVRIAAVLHPEEAAMVWAALERMVKEGYRHARPLVRDGSSEGTEPVPAGTSSHDSGIGGLDLSGTREDDVPAGMFDHGDQERGDHRHPALSRILDSECRAGSSAAQCDRHDIASSRSDASIIRNLADRDVPPGMFEVEAETEVRDQRARILPAGVGSDDEHGMNTPLDGTRHVPAGTQRPGSSLSRPSRSESQAHVQRFGRADALVAMAQEVLRGSRPDRSPTEMVVTISADRLRAANRPTMDPATKSAVDDLSDIGCCADGTAVSVDVVRRLACDAGIVTVVEGDDASPLSVGRKTRSIPGSMKRALLRRDGGCRFPGCSNRLFVEGHHVEHWADGGETKLTNLVSLCSHHHRYVHEYGYRIELRDHDVVFVDPRGRFVEPSPAPVQPGQRGWETIRRRNADLEISERTLACEWDGRRLNLVGCIDELVRAEDRAARKK